MNYKLFITASGTGSRLGELTKNTNKSIIDISGKFAISYIIDNYPEDTEIVITVGYFGDKVINAVKKQYPNRKITFVEVDKYEGIGSSLAYSMLQARDYLQSPFIFHACDTITSLKIDNFDYNFSVGCKVNDSSQYTTFNTSGEDIKDYNIGKGAKTFDLAHVGIAGIFNYQVFWETIENIYKNNPSDSSLNDVIAISSMIDQGIKFKFFEINDWLDTGNLESLEYTKKALIR